MIHVMIFSHYNQQWVLAEVHYYWTFGFIHSQYFYLLNVKSVTDQYPVLAKLYKPKIPI